MSKPQQRTEKQTQNFYTRATVDMQSIVDTETERSFSVVFATENPVLRYSWYNEERFNEILVCDPANIRAGRLEALAVPLLDGHNRYDGVKGQLGRADSFSIGNGECRAKIIFSLQDEFAGIWKDIKAGIIRSISCGYSVYKYIREEVVNSDVPNYRAVDWEPMEISLEPVPADFGSKIERKEGGASHDVIIEFNNPVQNNRSNMEVVEKKEGAEQTPTNQPTQERSAAQPSATPVVDEAKIRSESVTAERTRVKEINEMVRSAKLKNEFAEKLINDGTTVEQSRKLVIDELAKQDTTPTGGPSARGDEKEGQRNAAIDGLMHRAQPGSVELKDQAHDFKHMKLVRLAEERLAAYGVRTLGMSPGEIIGRAIATTDYTQILGTTVQRFLRKFYQAQSFAWKNIASPISAPDFRVRTGLAVSGKVTFEEVSQNGEYKNSLLLTEENATVKLKTFGRKITIGRQAIINDDLGVFNYLPNLIAMGASQFQADKVWGLLTSNAKAPDGTALFHATHGNLAGAGGALGIDTLSAARTAFTKIKTPAGDYMPLVPKYLIVPSELETAAEQLMTSILANQFGTVNPFSGKFTILTDPRLSVASTTAWYLSIDPSTYQNLVYAYLEGEEGLYTESKVDFDNDAVVTKARLDFDCACWDYRGFYKNPGA